MLEVENVKVRIVQLYHILISPGIITPRFCKKHALDNMVNIKTKKCENHGCFTIPHYNYPKIKKARFCKRHALNGMIITSYKECPNCKHYYYGSRKQGCDFCNPIPRL